MNSAKSLSPRPSRICGKKQKRKVNTCIKQKKPNHKIREELKSAVRPE